MLSIAGTAHWQAGKVERHNQIAKDMIQKNRNHTQTKGEQAMKEMAVKISHAKNSLVREHGWSPNTSVFGREPRVCGGLLQQGTPLCTIQMLETLKNQVARRMRYRYHAKLEYIKFKPSTCWGRQFTRGPERFLNPKLVNRFSSERMMC